MRMESEGQDMGSEGHPIRLGYLEHQEEGGGRGHPSSREGVPRPGVLRVKQG